MSNKYSFIAVFVVVVVCSRIYAQTFNCPALGGATGLNCKEGTTCCGANTKTPSCVDPKSDHKCCTWYISAQQCNSTYECCGSYGYGESSQTFCCAPNTKCCSLSGDGSNTCCGPRQVCCAVYKEFSWCCPRGNACGDGYHTQCIPQ